ncbi:MAG: PHB depolymerase family esterase [Salibacteraceae bacterium]
MATFPRLYLIIPVLAAFLLCNCKKSKFDSDLFKIEHDGEKRTYLLHVPDDYSSDERVSLIFALHGGTGSARNIESQSGLVQLSESEGFVLCSPNGLKRTWNAGDCCGKASENNVDDVGFISALIDKLIDEYSIDPKRVYITGMSNGGFMCYRLACELSDKIAAIAPVAGTMTSLDCAPSEAVSVIHFHSELDSNIPLDGGVGDGLSDHENQSLEDVFDLWFGLNECQSSDIELKTDCSLERGFNCSDSTALHFYITEDGGHSWPGGNKGRSRGDEPSKAVDANLLMWEFFQKHPKP